MLANEAFQGLADRIAPGSTVTDAQRLRGGVSAQVVALTLDLGRGAKRQVVVRQHGDLKSKDRSPMSLKREFELARVLHGQGLKVPEPIACDVEGSLLGAPCYVMAFIAGSSRLPEAALIDRVEQMADFLAELHAIDTTSLELPNMPSGDDAVLGALHFLPQQPQFEWLRSQLSGLGHTQTTNQQVLLHGDFWPGNVLWQAGRLTAVVDWEDASLGDPLSDLAGSRLELFWRHGERAMRALTRRYLQLNPIDTQALPLWELYGASAMQHYLGDWGFSAEEEAKAHKAMGEVIDQSARILSGELPPDYA